MKEKATDYFFRHFVHALADDGYGIQDSLRYLWRPHDLSDLKITGDDRDRSLSRLRLTAEQLREVLDQNLTDGQECPKQKVVYVIVPGFMHETLRHLSFHEEIERPGSQHEIVMLKPTGPGVATAESHLSKGGGLKVFYAKYPRSNAASEHINQPLFELLHESRTLRRLVLDEGYKIVFVGYSYGCALTLELLADLNSKRFEDCFIVQNTSAFLALCGAIGGSYLADDALSQSPQILSVSKLVERTRKVPYLGKWVGLPTDQFKDDMVGGVRSLTRAERAARMKIYAPDLPAHVQYFSLGAVMPRADYRRRLLDCNLDDYILYLQSKVTEPFSVYNDGQVMLEDNLIPRPDHISANNHHYLGVVRAHHWAVSYRTFNFGNNTFPRRSFYKAIFNTLAQYGVV
jgi:pimeloyl-ACP methyl ester carboxylesterase